MPMLNQWFDKSCQELSERTYSTSSTERASGARYDLDCTYEERWSSTKQEDPKSMTCEETTGFENWDAL